MDLPDEIICVDCGGRCYLGSKEPELGWEKGMIVFYRCKDCLDRWDIVLGADGIYHSTGLGLRHMQVSCACPSARINSLRISKPSR